VFAMPADVLTDDHFDAESALDRRIHELHQRLGTFPHLRIVLVWRTTTCM
jgi:hypothetical protein